MTRAAKTRTIVYSAILGFFIGLAFDPIHLGGDTQTSAHPLPHHFPKSPGNLSLRFAMVHDVLHERFTKHGPAYYAARNRQVQEALKSAQPDSDDYFKLVDDLAVGLLWTGQPAQAVEMMRDKLKRQQALGKKGKDLYSTYANLGTFLILWQLREGLTKPNAKERVRESIDWVKKSIEVNPDSHFGREQWQVVLEEFLLAVIDKPELLLKYDMIGDRLDQPVARGHYLKNPDAWGRSLSRGAPDVFAHVGAHIGKKSDDKAATDDWRRLYITEVGAEPDWTKDVGDISKPAPFDEPTLGILGMWTMGAGANPYFAVALGEIMLRVGQRYIAWSAFERAAETGTGLWPDEDIRRKFVAHCRARQTFIEQQLPAAERDQLRKTYQADLKLGQTYQQAYQDYEKQQLDKGKSIDDPKFYDEFFAARGQIASPVSKDEAFFTVRTESHHVPLPSMLLSAGVFAFAAALIVSFFPTTKPESDVFGGAEPAASDPATGEPQAQMPPALDPAPAPPPSGGEPETGSKSSET